MYTELTNLREVTLKVFNHFEPDLDLIVSKEGFKESITVIMQDYNRVYET